jgi:hypothetical protein
MQQNSPTGISVKPIKSIPLLLLIALASCATVPDDDSSAAPVESGPAAAAAENPRDPAEVLAVMNTSEGTEINAIDEGRVLSDYFPLPASYGDALVVETTRSYYYRGEELSLTFELIYTGLNPVAGGPIERGSTVGRAVAGEVGLVARAPELEPYLIGSSQSRPVYHEGYWYYFPGMYVSDQMKWLSFAPVEYEEFRAMYDHVTDPEEAPGVARFSWWVLYQTSLGEHPVPVADGNGYEQLVMFDDMPLRLRWQRGFLDYLENEYVLGDPIYLYLQISGLSAFEKEFDCYVRDFSLVPPEEIIEDRFRIVRETEYPFVKPEN